MYNLKLFILFILGLFALSFYSQVADSAGYYRNAITIDKSNADTIRHFSNTPESVAVYFYASKIRNDSLWLNVLPDKANWSERLKGRLERAGNWKYISFKLVKKINYAETRVFVKAFLSFKIEGNIQSGKDDVEVDLINGKWLITNP